MNQAGSENTFLKSVPYECILCNYNNDNVSDQNIICEDCKEWRWPVSGKRPSNVGSTLNTKHIAGVAGGYSSQAQCYSGVCLKKPTQQSRKQSILQQAWVFLSSVVSNPGAGCQRCNRNRQPCPSSESFGPSSLLSFLSAAVSPAPPAAPAAPTRTHSVSCKSSPSSCMSSCVRTISLCQNPEACPYLKSPSPSSKSSSSSLNTPCPYAKPPCPYANLSSCPGAKPTSPSDKPSCPAKSSSINARQSRPEPETSYSDLEPPCPHAKPSRTDDKPICPSTKPPHSNSRISVYVNFSNESLCSTCKESVAELTKAYVQKIASERKIKCPRCPNQKDTTCFLRNMIDQAWSYVMSSNTPQPRCTSCSPRPSASSRRSKSSSKPLRTCHCASCPKKSRQNSCCRKPVSDSKPIGCPVCLEATCPYLYNCELITMPASIRKSVQEGTHENRSTTCCVLNSLGIQSSFTTLPESNIIASPMCARQSPQTLKTCRSCVDKTSKNDMLACFKECSDIIKCSNPDQDLKVSTHTVNSTDETTVKVCLSLTKKQKKKPSFHKACQTPQDRDQEVRPPLYIDTEDPIPTKKASCPSKSSSYYKECYGAPIEKDFCTLTTENHQDKQIMCAPIVSPHSIQTESKVSNVPRKDSPNYYRFYY